jgi:putative DNA primase/helicase
LLRTYGTIREAWPDIEAVRRAIFKIKQIDTVEIPASRSFVASTANRYTIENAALTDAGDANLLLRNVGYDNIRYLVDQGVFAQWIDGWWQRLEGTPLDLISGEVARAHAVRAAAILSALPKDKSDDTATQKAQRTMAAAISAREHHLGGAGARKAVLECLMNKAEIRCDSNDFDMDPYLLGTLDGVVDLRTGQLRPAMQADKLLRRCPIHYRYPLQSTKEGQTHDFASFIAEICGAGRDKDGKVIPDLAAVDYLQRRFGLMLLGKNENQVFTVLPGKGANGKSVLFDLIASALGSTSNGGYFNRSSIASILSSFRPTDANAATPYLMTFKGARITALSEANEQSMFDPSAVKILTGETEVAGRANYGSATVIRITTNMCLMTNVIPRISHLDAALLSRLDILPFEVRWRRQNDDDPEVKDFPAADPWWAGEASHDKTILRDLLHWLVEGCLLELKQPLQDKPPRFRVAKQEYTVDNDPFSAWLTEAGWVLEEGAGPTLAGELYASYKSYIEGAGGKPVAQQSFSKRFYNQFSKQVKATVLGGGRNAMLGIKRAKASY